MWRTVAGHGGALLRRAEARMATPMRVLVYHRVAEPSQDPAQLAVSPEHFDQQMSIIARRARAVRLDAEVQGRTAQRPSRKAPRFAITFDDGYVDNLHTALPVLERYEVPATIFIITRCIDQPFFWWTHLADIIFGGPHDLPDTVEASCCVGLLDAAVDSTIVDQGPNAVYVAMHKALAQRPFDDRSSLLDQIATHLSFTPPAGAARPVTTAQLRQLDHHPLITIGAHTHSHPRLTEVSREEALDEIVQGDRHLDALLGPGRRLFAYPYGNANKAVVQVVRQAGHDVAFTTVSRPLSRFDNPRLLPRIATSDTTGAEFARLRGLSDVAAG